MQDSECSLLVICEPLGLKIECKIMIKTHLNILETYGVSNYFHQNIHSVQTAAADAAALLAAAEADAVLTSMADDDMGVCYWMAECIPTL